jgi:hypothetical protein
MVTQFVVKDNKIGLCVLQLFHAYRQTDGMSLTAAQLGCERAYKRNSFIIKGEQHLYSIHRYVGNASANPLTDASPQDE